MQELIFAMHTINKGDTLGVLIACSEYKSLHSVTSEKSIFRSCCRNFTSNLNRHQSTKFLKFGPCMKLIQISQRTIACYLLFQQLTLQFHSTLSELLDRQSPLKIKMVVEHLPQVKSSAISEANQNNKHQRGQLEHWWCHSQLSADDHTKQYVYKSFFHLPNLNI